MFRRTAPNREFARTYDNNEVFLSVTIERFPENEKVTLNK